MEIYDISQVIEPNMIVYKDKAEKRPVFQITRHHDQGGVRESSVTLDVHTGTHLDAPLHMQSRGSTIDEMDLTKLLAPCRVIDLTLLDRNIEKEDLEKHSLQAGLALILKTRNSFEDFFNLNFIALAESGARYLADLGIPLIGTDGLGIERGQTGHPTHHALFNAGIYILEGLSLKQVPPGHYQLIALPLKLKGLDASPVRAVLIKE